MLEFVEAFLLEQCPCNTNLRFLGYRGTKNWARAPAAAAAQGGRRDVDSGKFQCCSA